MRRAAFESQNHPKSCARQVANLPPRRSYHPVWIRPQHRKSFFERRSRRTIRAFGSPNTPRTVALARKSANEYPSDRRRCRFPDSAIAQRAKIERTSKLKKAAIHKLFRRYDPSKPPTRFPEDPNLDSGAFRDNVGRVIAASSGREELMTIKAG